MPGPAYFCPCHRYSSWHCRFSRGLVARGSQRTLSSPRSCEGTVVSVPDSWVGVTDLNYCHHHHHRHPNHHYHYWCRSKASWCFPVMGHNRFIGFSGTSRVLINLHPILIWYCQLISLTTTTPTYIFFALGLRELRSQVFRLENIHVLLKVRVGISFIHLANIFLSPSVCKALY